MIRTTSLYFRFAAISATFLMANNVLAVTLSELTKPDPNARHEVKRKMPPSRILSAKEMARVQGKNGENPYMAGQSKWDIVYKGVNLMTGNFSTSATDL